MVRGIDFDLKSEIPEVGEGLLVDHRPLAPLE